MCQNKTHAKLFFAVCHKKHTAKYSLPCAKKKHTAKHEFAICFSFTVCFLKHTRKNSYLPCARELAHGKSQISSSAIYMSPGCVGNRSSLIEMIGEHIISCVCAPNAITEDPF